jgi:predicted nucleotide-binding protein (sugar kinase/HSP70/actin superfamily)
VRARIQAWFQHRIGRSFERALEDYLEVERIVPVERMMELCGPYIHRDYVGDPPIALGGASALARTGISGVAAILPFTCLPGTVVASLSASFRRDHDGLPWVDIAYDGQEDTGIATRLQAFVHQAREYCRRRGYDRPRVWNRG